MPNRVGSGAHVSGARVCGLPLIAAAIRRTVMLRQHCERHITDGPVIARKTRQTRGAHSPMPQTPADPRLVAARAAPKRRLRLSWSDPLFRAIVWQAVIIG